MYQKPGDEFKGMFASVMGFVLEIVASIAVVAFIIWTAFRWFS